MLDNDDLSSGDLLDPWAFQQAVKVITEAGHHGQKQGESILWLLQFDTLGLPLSGVKSDDGIKEACCRIAMRYSAQRELENTGIRKKGATEKFFDISRHGKQFASGIRSLTPDLLKLALEPTSPEMFGSDPRAAKQNLELENLVSELEGDLIELGVVRKGADTHLLRLADKSEKIARLFALVSLREDLKDTGGRTNIHRRFEVPANWELFHNVNRLFLLSEKCGHPLKTERVTNVCAYLHQSVSGEEEVDFRGTYSKYFKAWDEYTRLAVELKSGLVELGYKEQHQIDHRFDRALNEMPIFSGHSRSTRSKSLERETKNAEIDRVEEIGREFVSAKKILEKTYVFQS